MLRNLVFCHALFKPPILYAIRTAARTPITSSITTRKPVGSGAIHGGQGADTRTPWARGQTWAIYGYTMMHRETGKAEYLAKATSLADIIMAHPNMPANSEINVPLVYAEYYFLEALLRYKALVTKSNRTHFGSAR